MRHGSVTLPNRARNRSPGTSGSRRSDDFTPRLMVVQASLDPLAARTKEVSLIQRQMR